MPSILEVKNLKKYFKVGIDKIEQAVDDVSFEIKHGKTSIISHDGEGVYNLIPQDFVAVRYHSLAGTNVSLPDELSITSQSESGIIMGVRHKTYTVEGVQFHPESIATEHGKLLLQNFLDLRTGNWTRTN